MFSFLSKNIVLWIVTTEYYERLLLYSGVYVILQGDYHLSSKLLDVKPHKEPQTM